MSRILVVDDDHDILTVIEILLSMRGFKVEVTTKWENTLDKIQSFKPDLILLDVLISGNDGRTLCKKLKSQPEIKNIPIIIFSAHMGLADTISECGANDFIAKPFDIDELLLKIDSQLSLN